MEKPYLKKLETISKFTIWIVDGNYIRGNIDEEFTNFGQHYRFNFIPENEFWIDKECQAGEEYFYITHMLIEFKLMSEGISYEEAIIKADRAERSERMKSKLMKKEIKVKNNKIELFKDIHKKLLKKYSGKVKVWIVDGELVRDIFFIDFTGGGHDKIYNFIPKDEIWIDDDALPIERKFVLLHELHERNLMKKEMDYEKAHESASKIEFYCRHNPKETLKKIKEELEIS